jgi:hypothetical protein
MMTSEDVQYEPRSRKVSLLAESAVSMMSGDAALYTEIKDLVARELLAIPHDGDKRRPRISHIAELFGYYWTQVRHKRASRAILGPLGLNAHEFLARQQEFEPGLVQNIARELMNFPVNDVAVIVAGIDDEGSQIFTMSNGDVRCNSAIGFAAIGSGARHAESQFMLAGHHPEALLPDTLFLTYTAKKRSEKAPGVGAATDMIMIQPDRGVTLIRDDIEDKVAVVYDRMVRKEAKIVDVANNEVSQYVAAIIKNSEQQRMAEASQGQAAATND